VVWRCDMKCTMLRRVVREAQRTKMMMVRKIDAASSHIVMPNTIFWKRPTASTLLIMSAAFPKNVNRPVHPINRSINQSIEGIRKNTVAGNGQNLAFTIQFQHRVPRYNNGVFKMPCAALTVPYPSRTPTP
jgi:hypothetical protein